mgnify:FL=1
MDSTKTVGRQDLIGGDVFHVLNRGVDQRDIFLDDKDHFRFIHNLFEFNNTEPVLNLGYFLKRGQSIDLRNQYIYKTTKLRQPRKLIVEILAFCLMPNHFHLLLRQIQDGGITMFMRKLGIGYANYFNTKYERKGTLFQSRYKAIPVLHDTHFIHLPYYIHFNPLGLIMQNWKEGNITDCEKAIKFLESYRWSSHLDYIGIKNFPSVTQREFLLDIFGGVKDYKKTIEKWMKELDVAYIRELTLE